MTALSAFVCGVVFALGLGLGGMTQPARVIGFLDVTGPWDPTLAFVMGGAVSTASLLFPRILARSKALSGARFALPTRQDIDAPLILGAALFGVGWGLAGYCPGPALVSLVTGSPSVFIFVAAMIAGLFLAGRLMPGSTGSHPR